MFGLGEILLGKKRLVTYSHLKSLHYSYDVQGLVEAMDDASPSVMPFAIQFLKDLASIGWSDKILGSGIGPRLEKVLLSDDNTSKKEAAVLISTLISQGRGREVLDGRSCIQLLEMLESEDEGLRSHIAYCITEMVSLGYAPLLVENGGLEKLFRQLGSEDQSLLVQTLAALQTLSFAGYGESINRPEVVERVNELRVRDEESIRQYADSLYYALTGWADRTMGATEAAGQQTSQYVSYEDVQSTRKKEQVLEDRVEDERYVRPTRGAPKVRKAMAGKLRTDGRMFENEAADETVLVLGPPGTDRTPHSDGEDEEIVVRTKKRPSKETDGAEEDFEIEA